MKTLHSIIIAAQQAWVWGYAQGGNGVRIADPGATRWGEPLLHAYLIARGTPPPIPGPGVPLWPERRYWYPWRGQPESAIRPRSPRPAG